MRKENTKLLNSALLTMGGELTTTINSVLVLLRMLSFGGNTLTREQKEYLETLNEEGKHLQEIISIINDTIKMQNGAVDNGEKAIDLYPVLSRLASHCSGVAFKRNIELKIELEDELDGVKTDEAGIARIITNLLHNTIQYTEQEHMVGLEARKNGETVDIAIWNDGAALTDELLDQLFIPTVHKNTHFTHSPTLEKGAGIFLAQYMLSHYNGTVNTENPGGRGNRISIQLPLEPHAP